MIEYVLKKPYSCELGTLPQGATMRIMAYNGRPFVLYEGAMVEDTYNSVLLKLINDKKLHDEYLHEREVIENKV